MLAAIDAAVSSTLWRVEVNRRANSGQALRISLEGEAFFDQLLAEVARLEWIIWTGNAWHLIVKADILIAAGKEPEIVSLAVVLLTEHLADAGTLCCQFLEVSRVKLAPKDLFKILVLFDDDDDVVIDR
jgi:hypothetical protein